MDPLLTPSRAPDRCPEPADSSAQTILDAWLRQLQADHSEEAVVENRLDIDSIFSNDLEFDMEFLAELAKPSHGDGGVSLHELGPDLGLLCPTGSPGLEPPVDLGSLAGDELFGDEPLPTPAAAPPSRPEPEPVPPETPAPADAPAEPPVASISVVTNKRQGKTVITICTPRGRQSFVLPTADLTQAARVLRALQRKRSARSPAVAAAAAAASKAVVTPEEQKQKAVECKKSCLPSREAKTQAKSEDDETDQEMAAALCKLGIDLSAVEVQNMPDSPVCKFLCPVAPCTSAFPILFKLKVHILRHFNCRPYKCNYIGCQWNFFERSKLNRHRLTHEKASLKCPLEGCAAAFRSRTNLRRHQRLLHPDDGTGRGQVPKVDPSAHQQADRAGRDPVLQTNLAGQQAEASPPPPLPEHFQCSLCPRTFGKASALRRHEKAHTLPGTDLSCPLPDCDYVATTRQELKQHETRHADKPFKCAHPECTWTFLNHAKLKRHMAQHTGRRGFRCPYAGCDKSYRRMEYLSSHVRLHMGRYYLCPHNGCRLRFTQQTSLAAHIRTMHGARSELPAAGSVWCAFCGAHFKLDLYLQIHLQDVHGTSRSRILGPESSNVIESSGRPRRRRAVKRQSHRSNPKFQPESLNWMEEDVGDPYDCSYCSAHFTSEEYLRIHKQDVHGVVSTGMLNHEASSERRFNPEDLNWLEDPERATVDVDGMLTVHVPVNVDTDNGPSEVVLAYGLTQDQCQQLGMNLTKGMSSNRPAEQYGAGGQKKALKSSTKDVVRQLRQMGVGVLPAGLRRTSSLGCARTDITSCHLAERRARQAAADRARKPEPRLRLSGSTTIGASLYDSALASDLACRTHLETMPLLCESDLLGYPSDQLPHSTINLSDLT